MPVDTLPAANNLFPAAPSTLIRNWNLQGSTNGVLTDSPPGVLPTNFYDQSSPAWIGLSVQVVGTGTDATTNVRYVDIRFFGTVTAGAKDMRLAMEQYFIIPATNDQRLRLGIWCAVVGGTLGTIASCQVLGQLRNAGGSSLQSGGFGTFTPTATL